MMKKKIILPLIAFLIVMLCSSTNNIYVKAADKTTESTTEDDQKDPVKQEEGILPKNALTKDKSDGAPNNRPPHGNPGETPANKNASDQKKKSNSNSSDEKAKFNPKNKVFQGDKNKSSSEANAKQNTSKKGNGSDTISAKVSVKSSVPKTGEKSVMEFYLAGIIIMAAGVFATYKLRAEK